MEKDFIIRQTDEELQQLLNKVQTPDTAPRENSDELITSGAVFGALKGKQEKIENLPEILESVGRKTEEAISLTWQELKELRDDGNLKPGQWYRITDYMTTTTQLDTRSAGHQFDILVMAESVDVLSENAMAIQHTTDEDDYFHDAILEAWELKYCLDNDTDRFAWADAENGKGVIYQMKDEWGNQCPYDFKNIQFKRCYCELEEFDGNGCYLAIPGMTTGPDNDTLPAQEDDNFIWVYTFSCLASLDEDVADHPEQADASMGMFKTENEMQPDYGDSPRPSNNIMEPYFISQSIDDGPLLKVRALPNITFQQFFTDEYSYHCSENHISGACHDLSCRCKKFYNNNFSEANVEYCYFSGIYIQYNTFSGDVLYNTFSGNVGNNTFSGNLQRNTFSGYIYQNTFSGDVQRNTFSGYVWNNTFSGNVQYNTFSGDVRYNTFSGDVENNTFSGEVGNNTFSGYVRYNTFSGNVWYNTFSGYIYQNTFSGNLYESQILGKCQHLRFGQSGQNLQYIQQVGECVATSLTTVNVAADKKYLQVVTANSAGNIIVETPYA